MASTLVTNIGTLVAGDGSPARTVSSVLLEDGVVAEVGSAASTADVVIDAAGLTAVPGFVDGHVHPTVGEWTPAQNAAGWVRNYLHGGTTTMVSAGELHVPALPFDDLEPDLVLGLARLGRRTTGRVRPSGVKVCAGTLLLVPGLTEPHFDQMADTGITHLKFIFYDWARLDDGEAQQYVAWAHERSMTVKMHSGGVSRSGSSRVAGQHVVTSVRPDVVAHISGGPIPMPDEQICGVVDELPDAAVEVCSSMNYRATMVTVAHLRERGALHRLTLGTDTPGGTGVIPRGMLRNVCFLSSVCGLPPETAIAAATGNTARAHGLAQGVLEPGRPADLVLLGPVTGSPAGDAVESFALGDLPGISMVLVDGVPLVDGRSEQTPPPRRLARVVKD